MLKRMLAFTGLLIIMTACGLYDREGDRGVYGLMTPIAGERGPDLQNIQVSQSQVLPPYGRKVTAETAVLQLRISSTQKEAGARIEDVQKATEIVAELADKSASISMERVSINQVGGSYEGVEFSTPTFQNLDTSVVTVKLTSELEQYDYDFAGSILAFNDFLNTIVVPKTITIRALSVEADLGDLEGYRSQIIDQVYQELDAKQSEYGDTVKFGVTGLYDPLRTIPLSDVEYYVYLVPVITVIEF